MIKKNGGWFCKGQTSEKVWGLVGKLMLTVVGTVVVLRLMAGWGREYEYKHSLFGSYKADREAGEMLGELSKLYKTIDQVYPASPHPRSGGTSAVAASAESVLVERVVDGNTLVIAGGDRIRLIGVDTPETMHPTKPVQLFGKEASEFTRRMVEGKRVQLRFDPYESKDKYGRTLAYVYVDGQFLNEMLVREGLARAMTNYPFSAEAKERFREAEAEANAARRGIWSLPSGKTDVGLQSGHRKAG